MRIRWRLRMAAAQREVWTGAQLRRLLRERAGLELSAAAVSALLTKEPAQVKLSTLAALCTALECTPNDLFEVDTTPVQRPVPPPRAVPEEPKAVSVRGRRCRRCEGQRWASGSGTAPTAARRLAIATGWCAAAATAGGPSRPPRPGVRAATGSGSCSRAPAGAS